VAVVWIGCLVLCLFLSVCVCLVVLCGSVVFLIFFLGGGVSQLRVWTAGNARWAFAGCE